MIRAVLLDAAVLGSLLTVASLGLSLAYAVFRFPNFAHGDLLTVGAYAAWVGATPYADPGNPLALATAALASVVACMAILLLVDAAVLQPLLARRRTGSVIVAAFAVGLLLRNAVVLAFGPGEVAIDRGIEMATPVAFAGLAIGRLTATEQAVALALVPLVAGLHWTLHRTAAGRDMRAFAENPDLAGLCGLAIPKLRRQAWLLCGTFCGLAGYGLILLGPAQPGSGAEFMLPALAVVVLGGTGSVWGVMAGALLLGLLESLLVHTGFAEWRQLAAFAVVMAVLSLRPSRLASDR